MKVICDQNATARGHLDDPTIIGWMHGEKTVEVLGEDRSLSTRSGAFSDTFKSWAVHCYRIK